MSLEFWLHQRAIVDDAIAVYGLNARLADENALLRAQTASAASELEQVKAALAEANAEIERLKAAIPAPAPLPLLTRAALTVPADDADLQTLRAAALPVKLAEVPYTAYLANTVMPHYAAVLFGYLASGDALLIDTLETTMEAVKPDLLMGYGWGGHETFIGLLLTLHALVMKQHGRDWQAWLNVYRARYGDRVPEDNVTHFYGAAIVTYTCLHLLTGEAHYADERDHRIAVFRAHVQRTPEGWLDINQRMPITETHPALTEAQGGIPELNYVRYWVIFVLLMLEFGRELIDPQWFAISIAVRCFRADGKIAFYLDGSLNGGRDFDAAKWSSSLLGLLGRWNGVIAAHTNAMAGNSVMLAAMRLWQRESLPVNTPA